MSRNKGHQVRLRISLGEEGTSANEKRTGNTAEPTMVPMPTLLWERRRWGRWRARGRASSSHECSACHILRDLQLVPRWRPGQGQSTTNDGQGYKHIHHAKMCRTTQLLPPPSVTEQVSGYSALGCRSGCPEGLGISGITAVVQLGSGGSGCNRGWLHHQVVADLNGRICPDSGSCWGAGYFEGSSKAPWRWLLRIFWWSVHWFWTRDSDFPSISRSFGFCWAAACHGAYSYLPSDGRIVPVTIPWGVVRLCSPPTPGGWFEYITVHSSSGGS